LIVKASYDLKPGKPVTLSIDQPFPSGDEFYPDDVEMQHAPRYESDFAFFKPNADLFCVGHCHPPDKKPAQACSVEFCVGSYQKKLYVIGNRSWKSIMGIAAVNDPEPFDIMELRYENSFGGEGFEENPQGKGFGGKKNDVEKRVSLPNIEDPKHLIDDPDMHPHPVGIGPLGKMWQQRLSRIGTYGDDWMKERWPWFARDFDYLYFNGAPTDLQVKEYLKGDESIIFKNLHPDHPVYESRLPGIRVRCFLNSNNKVRPGLDGFHETPMNLDTLWADMDNEKIVLVWRGVATIESEEYEKEIDHIFILPENLSERPATLENCRKLFLKSLVDEEKEWTGEDESLPEKKMEDTGKAVESQSSSIELEKKEIKMQTAALLKKLGIDPDRIPAKEKMLKEQDKLIDKLFDTNPVKRQAMEEADQKGQLSRMMSEAGIDLDNLLPQSDTAGKELIRLFKELGMENPSFLKSPEMIDTLTLLGAVIPKMGMDPENLTPLIEEAKKQLGTIKEKLGIIDSLEENSPSPALTRELVIQKAKKKESFVNENLTGLDLSGLFLKDLDFSGAVLTRANLKNTDLSSSVLANTKMQEADLSGSDLTGTNFSEADLNKADLSRACLKDADFTSGILSEALLNRADLTRTIFEKAKMDKAEIKSAFGKNAYFTGTDLSKAILSESDFSGADFSRAVLNQADFRHAILFEACLEGVTALNAAFDGADLTLLRASEKSNFEKSSFIGVKGRESVWHEANLNETRFSYSNMEGADFSGTTCIGADMEAADMKFSRFIKADLTRARLVNMNLFQALMEKANFTETDLSGSNMFGAEFLDAGFKNTIVQGTNLKMTKQQTRTDKNEAGKG
jgi:uncharacterized protein YjbI with pentapeptide repeats